MLMFLIKDDKDDKDKDNVDVLYNGDFVSFYDSGDSDIKDDKDHCKEK